MIHIAKKLVDRYFSSILKIAQKFETDYDIPEPSDTEIMESETRFKKTPEFKSWHEKYFGMPPDVIQWLDELQDTPKMSAEQIRQHYLNSKDVVQLVRDNIKEEMRFKDISDWLKTQFKPQAKQEERRNWLKEQLPKKEIDPELLESINLDDLKF